MKKIVALYMVCMFVTCLPGRVGRAKWHGLSQEEVHGALLINVMSKLQYLNGEITDKERKLLSLENITTIMRELKRKKNLKLQKELKIENFIPKQSSSIQQIATYRATGSFYQRSIKNNSLKNGNTSNLHKKTQR